MNNIENGVEGIVNDTSRKADIRTPVTSVSDLDIADSSGNVIARF